MTAFLVPLFYRVLFLVCVAIDVGFSSQRDADVATDSKSALNMLGINTARVPSSPPENVTCTLADTKASHYMVQLFLKLAKPSGEVINPGAVKGNRVHGFIDNGPCDRRTGGKFKFNVTIPRYEVVKFAELQLYKMPSTLDTHPNSSVTVHIVDNHSRKQIASKRLAMDTVAWISFTLPRHIILRWNRNPQSNAGISVEITDKNMPNAVQFATGQTNPSFQPVLVVHCSDPSTFLEKMNISGGMKPTSRRVRSRRSSHAGKCQIRKLAVQFKDLGWDKWVIAPSMYSANYCTGTCLDLYDTKLMSDHALIQLLMHQKDPRGVHPPCCVPSNMASISMLYYGQPGESTYVLKTMDDFVVKSCACR